MNGRTLLFKREEGNNPAVWVNGISVALSPTATLLDGYVTQRDVNEIGNESKDGYLSDYFLVDDQALEPETFGDFFEGKWGPLDASVVNSNIKEAFPDDQYNTDEVWSSTIIANASYKGDLLQPHLMAIKQLHLELDGGSTGECHLIIPGPFTNVTSIELLGRVEGSGSNAYTVSGNGFTTVDDWANMGALPLSLPVT